MPDFSSHAHTRSAQRSIDPDHIQFVLAWGHPIQQGRGRVAWHLGHREVANARNAGVQVPERCIGVTVVLAGEQTIVTLVRTSDRRRLRRGIGGGR